MVLFIFFQIQGGGEVKPLENPSPDRRIRKTLGLLHEALFSLIQEKDYDAIVVKEILDRANVGRSTFYTHFRDKDDLLVSGIRSTLQHALASCPASKAKRPESFLNLSQSLFEQIYRHYEAGTGKMGMRARIVVHEHLQVALTEVIADDIRKSLPHTQKVASRFPSDLLVQYLASTFILVLNWWMKASKPMPPKEIHALFCALIQPTLTMANQAWL